MKTDGSIVDGGKVYIQNIILAPDTVTANLQSTAAQVANLVATVGNNQVVQSEIGTEAGTIPNLYIWDNINKDGRSRLESNPVTSETLGTQSFYQGLGFNSNYWNYMGLSAGSVSDAAIVPQEKGTFELNTSP